MLWSFGHSAIWSAPGIPRNTQDQMEIWSQNLTRCVTFVFTWSMMQLSMCLLTRWQHSMKRMARWILIISELGKRKLCYSYGSFSLVLLFPTMVPRKYAINIWTRSNPAPMPRRDWLDAKDALMGEVKCDEPLLLGERTRDMQWKSCRKSWRV